LSIHELIYLLKVREELREECVGAEVGEEQRRPEGWGGAASAPRLGRRMRRPELREECPALGEPRAVDGDAAPWRAANWLQRRPA